MQADSGESQSLIPAAELRGKLCSEAQLSKRAAVLLRRECDDLGASLVRRANSVRATRGGQLEGSDIWEALREDPSLRWLANRLCRENAAADSSERQQQTDDASTAANASHPNEWLPPLAWRRAAPPCDNDPPMPLREAFLTTDA